MNGYEYASIFHCSVCLMENIWWHNLDKGRQPRFHQAQTSMTTHLSTNWHLVVRYLQMGYKNNNKKIPCVALFAHCFTQNDVAQFWCLQPLMLTDFGANIYHHSSEGVQGTTLGLTLLHGGMKSMPNMAGCGFPLGKVCKVAGLILLFVGKKIGKAVGFPSMRWSLETKSGKVQIWGRNSSERKASSAIQRAWDRRTEWHHLMQKPTVIPSSPLQSPYVWDK